MKNITLIFILFFSFNPVFCQPLQNFSLVGFGEATTGGNGGSIITVTSYAQLKSYAESSNSYIIQVKGKIENGADGGSVNIKSNKTIIGLGDSALLYGVGLTLNGYNNVIIRNLKLTMMGVTTRTNKTGVYSPTGDEGRPQILTNGGDCIRITGNSYNIWVDHCELYSENPDIQTNIDLYDGLVDITGASHNITVSWNYIHDHHKTHLVGSSETDTTNRKITFHHNYYVKCKDRLPLYRSGTGHFFNNFLYNCPNGVNTRINACVYVEKNHFENVTSGTVYSKSSTILGYATLVDNLFINSKTPTAGTCSHFIPSNFYKYDDVLNDKNDVKEIVTKWAGVGKLDVHTEIAEFPANKYEIFQYKNMIQVENLCNPTLIIYDITGSKLSISKENKIDLSNLNTGVYILHVKENNQLIQFHKFIQISGSGCNNNFN
jgi:pectate lyase